MVVEGAIDAGYDEVVVVIGADGEERQGRVLEVGEGIAVVQVFSGTDGLTPAASSCRVQRESDADTRCGGNVGACL